MESMRCRTNRATRIFHPHSQGSLETPDGDLKPREVVCTVRHSETGRNRNRTLTHVSREDRNAALIAGVTAGFMIAQQIAGKATRDALFLSHFAATELPKVIIAAAGVSVVAVALMSRLMGKLGPARLVPAAFVLSAGVFVAEWALLPIAPGPSAWLVYLHLATFGAIVISGFWSVVSERFDPNTAKKQMARIGAGATLGGVVGGLGAERLAVMLDARTTLLVLASLNIVCALGVFRVGRGQTRAAKEAEASESGLTILRRAPYLQHLAILVGLVAITSVLLDFALKASAAAEYQRTEDLMRFFGVFYTVTGVLTFVVQGTLARRALARLGLGGTIALLPLSVIVFGTLGAALTQLWTLAVAKGAQFVAANSFFRSGYELLYTPLSAQEKRPTKTIIDVAFERIGDAVGGGIVFLVLLVSPLLASQVIVGLALVAAVCALLVARKLHQGYIDALAASLKSGTLRLTKDDVLDATTKRTLVQTTMALDRAKLLEEIALLRGTDPDQLSPSAPPRPVESALTKDPAHIRQLLEERPLPLATVGVLIPWLADADLNRPIIESLSTVATEAQDQLVDALLNAEQPFAVRRRLPRILVNAEGERARRGLTLGLQDERFEVRYQCCQSLALMQRRASGAFEFEEELVFDAVLRELKVGKHVWESQRLLDEDSNENSPWLDSTIRARVHRSVEHIFTLLSLCLDSEALELTLTALGTNDQVLRGTALEYLDSVLPGDVRTKLWPLLAPNHRRRASGRPRKQIVEDLLESLDSFSLDHEALKEHALRKSGK